MEFNTNVLITAAIAATVWSAVWAALHQYTKLFRYVLHDHTFISVIIGCAGNLVIAFFAIDLQDWVTMVVIFAFSSSFVAIRSLYDRQKEAEQVGDSYEELKAATAEVLKELKMIRGQDGISAEEMGVHRQ
jgi:hypothetical protein